MDESELLGEGVNLPVFVSKEDEEALLNGPTETISSENQLGNVSSGSIEEDLLLGQHDVTGASGSDTSLEESHSTKNNGGDEPTSSTISLEEVETEWTTVDEVDESTSENAENGEKAAIETGDISEVPSDPHVDSTTETAREDDDKDDLIIDETEIPIEPVKDEEKKEETKMEMTEDELLAVPSLPTGDENTISEAAEKELLAETPMHTEASASVVEKEEEKHDFPTETGSTETSVQIEPLFSGVEEEEEKHDVPMETVPSEGEMVEEGEEGVKEDLDIMDDKNSATSSVSETSREYLGSPRAGTSSDLNTYCRKIMKKLHAKKLKAAARRAELAARESARMKMLADESNRMLMDMQGRYKDIQGDINKLTSAVPQIASWAARQIQQGPGHRPVPPGARPVQQPQQMQPPRPAAAAAAGGRMSGGQNGAGVQQQQLQQQRQQLAQSIRRSSEESVMPNGQRVQQHQPVQQQRTGSSVGMSIVQAQRMQPPQQQLQQLQKQQPPFPAGTRIQVVGQPPQQQLQQQRVQQQRMPQPQPINRAVMQHQPAAASTLPRPVVHHPPATASTIPRPGIYQSPPVIVSRQSLPGPPGRAGPSTSQQQPPLQRPPAHTAASPAATATGAASPAGTDTNLRKRTYQQSEGISADELDLPPGIKVAPRIVDIDFTIPPLPKSRKLRVNVPPFVQKEFKQRPSVQLPIDADHPRGAMLNSRPVYQSNSNREDFMISKKLNGTISFHPEDGFFEGESAVRVCIFYYIASMNTERWIQSEFATLDLKDGGGQVNIVLSMDKQYNSLGDGVMRERIGLVPVVMGNTKRRRGPEYTFNLHSMLAQEQRNEEKKRKEANGMGQGQRGLNVNGPI